MSSNTQFSAVDEYGELRVCDWLDLEYEECRRDFRYWLRNYGVIIEEDTGNVLRGLEIWSWENPEEQKYQDQNDFIDLLLSGDNVIVGKARQLGLSWLVENFEYWKLEFRTNIRIALIHRTDPEAMEHLERVRRIQQHQPEWIARKPVRTGRDSKHELALGTKKTYSIITAHPCTEGVGRGVSANIVHLEEFAFWPANLAKKVYAGLRATAGDTGRQLVIVSTANGDGYHKKGGVLDGNKYAAMWHDAEKGKGTFKTVFLPWYLHPRRSQPWYEALYEDLGEDLMHQEYPATPEEMFVRSGVAVYTNFSISQHTGRAVYDDSLPITLGFDWGFENPAVCLISQWYGSDQLKVLEEIYESKLTPSNLANLVMDRLRSYGVYLSNSEIEQLIQDKVISAEYSKFEVFDAAYADPSGAGEIGEFEERGMWFKKDTPEGGKLNHVKHGINAVRKLLGRTESIGLLIDREKCPNLIRQLAGYSYKENATEEQPVKKDDHAPDALRYMVYGKIGKRRRDWDGTPLEKEIEDDAA